MIGNGKKKGTTRFAYRPDAPVKQVSVAGSFTDWQPLRMRRQKSGDFVAVVPVRPGAHEYKFIVDNEWRVDPDNQAYAANPLGTVNSLLTVE